MMRRLKTKFSSSSLDWISNYIYFFFSQGIGIIVPLLITPIIIQRLGMSNFGLYAIYINIFNIAKVCIDYGSMINGVKLISIHRKNSEKVSVVVSETIHLKVFLFALIVFLSFPFLFLLGEADNLFWISLYFLMLVEVFNPSWILQGLEKFKFILFINFISKFSFLILVWFYLDSLILLGLILVLTNAIPFVFFWISRGYKLIQLSAFRTDLLKKNIASDVHFFISNIIISLYVQSPTILAKLFLGNYYAGLFKIAEQLLYIFRILIGVFNSITYPRVSLLLNNETRKKTLKFLKNSNFLHLAGITIMISLFLYFGNLILKFFTKDFSSFLNYNYNLLIISSFFTALNVPFFQIVLAKGKKQSYLIAILFGFFLFLISSFVLQYITVNFLSYSILLTEIFFAVIAIVMFKKF